MQMQIRVRKYVAATAVTVAAVMVAAAATSDPRMIT